MKKEYSFTIERNQHLNQMPTLESSLVRQLAATTEGYQKKITRKEGEDIARDFKLEEKAWKSIVNKIDANGVSLKEFLIDVMNIGYASQKAVDLNRTSGDFLIQGEKVPIFDGKKRIFYKANGEEDIKLSDGEGQAQEKKFVESEENAKQDSGNLISIRKFTDLLKQRKIENAEFISCMFNQNTLNGLIVDTVAFKLSPPSLHFGLWEFSRLEKIEVILNSDNKVIGFNVIQRMELPKVGGPVIKEGEFEESKIDEIKKDNIIRCATEIKLDSNNSEYLLGGCNISSMKTTFSSTGDLGMKVVKEMEYVSNHNVSDLTTKVGHYFTEEEIDHLRKEFYTGKRENLIQFLENEISKREEDLRIRGVKVGIAQDGIEKLLNEGRVEELKAKIDAVEIQRPVPKGFLERVTEIFSNLFNLIKEFFSSDKKKDEKIQAVDLGVTGARELEQPNPTTSVVISPLPQEQHQSNPLVGREVKTLEQNPHLPMVSDVDSKKEVFPPNSPETPAKREELSHGRNAG